MVLSLPRSAGSSPARTSQLSIAAFCALGRISSVAQTAVFQPLEDALQPSAVKVAQQRGASEPRVSGGNKPKSSASTPLGASDQRLVRISASCRVHNRCVGV